MSTASIGGLEGLRLPDLLVLIKQTAECARNRRVLDPCAAIVPDEVLQAKVLYTRARAWLLGESPRRVEPKWRRPGDVEAAFFALYGAALLAFGFLRRSAFLRWQALLLLLLAIAKTFLYDVRNLSQGYRVVSFLGLGALLMAISFAYQKDWLSLRAGPTGTIQPGKD